jgi:hypothetical protein
MADSKHFLLRLDPRLFETLRRWAKDDLRSINAQIEYLLTDQARRAGRLNHERSQPRLLDTDTPRSSDQSDEPEASLTPVSAHHDANEH